MDTSLHIHLHKCLHIHLVIRVSMQVIAGDEMI